MDGVVPIGASPFPLIGRRGLQDQLGIEPLLRDPSWRGGHYSEQPTNFPIALMAFWPLMFGSEYLLKKPPLASRANTISGIWRKTWHAF